MFKLVSELPEIMNYVSRVGSRPSVARVKTKGRSSPRRTRHPRKPAHDCRATGRPLTATNSRELLLTRCTEPEPELKLLLNKFKLDRLPQRPPTITAAALAHPPRCSADLRESALTTSAT